MKKKLTRSSFSALRETATLLNEREQRAVIGGDYWDDHGVWATDSSGNMYWTRTSDGDGGSYYGDSGYRTGSGVITQDQFFNWSGDWPGGYVEGMGYVPPDTIIYGGSGYYDGSGYYGDSGYYSSSGYEDPTQVNYYWWGKTEITNLDQQCAYDYYHNFENTGKIQSLISGLIVGFASWPVGAAVSIGGFFVSYVQGNAIYNAAQSGGIIIETTTTYGQMDPSTPGSGTTTMIKDSNGNTILIF